MQKIICPICDHVMKSSHYCHFCKQWVKHPNRINATYYLNERHPAHEINCEYHTNTPPAPPRRPVSPNRPAPARPTQRPQGIPGSPARSSSPVSGRPQNRKVPPALTVVIVIIVLMFFLNGLLPLLLFLL